MNNKAIKLRRCNKCGKYQVLLPNLNENTILGSWFWKKTEIEDCRKYQKGLLCRIGIHKWTTDK